MAQAPKMTPEEWADARLAWEQDEREGFTWLVNELALPVSPPAVRKTANKQGWAKSSGSPAKPSKPSSRAGVEIVESPQGKAQGRQGGKPKHVSETIRETFAETIETIGDGVSEDECDANSYAGHEQCAAEDGLTGDEEEEAGHLGNPGTARVHVWGESIQIRGKYMSIYPGIARSMAMLGATDEQMAEAFGVSRSTFLEWKNRHPEFAEEVHKGKMLADAQVAASTFHGAVGYSHPEEVIRVLADGTVVRVNAMKHYPPNPILNTFWLKNRQPELWKERVEVKEQPTIALVDKQAMDEIYRNALEHAAQVQERMMGRAERMGLTIDQGLDDGE